MFKAKTEAKFWVKFDLFVAFSNLIFAIFDLV